VLNLTWNEVWFVAFLFLLVWVVGYLPRLGNLLGDLWYGYKNAGKPPEGPSAGNDKGPAGPTARSG
jgi:hypothetical protein